MREFTHKFGRSLIAEAGIEINTKYNFSKTGSDTHSETVTYSIPQQKIKVPGNTTAVVSVHLKTVETTGKVDLATRYSGDMVFEGARIGVKWDMERIPLNTWTYYVKKNIPGLNKYLALEDNTKNILLKGEGSYKVKYGTIAEVNVEFVSHNGKLMDNGYTFEVVPEIVKK
ncbi:ETX/MTX2 family pore-forming toxin [Paenibacillus larvae]|nr:ETX/MTX2 family pore-forming toxin [Paenibacillus larvae]MDT2241382.1 ETX/MTX2 family pore-forming toxin [Paenibacillus larvae]